MREHISPGGGAGRPRRYNQEPLHPQHADGGG